MNDQQLLWHQNQWSVVTQALETARLPHALLLHGTRGLGKGRFMEQLARLLICASPQKHSDNGHLQACGQCRPCTQFSEEGEHADIFRLRPEEAGKQIKVDVTREAIQFSGLASHYGGRKLLLIEPAEALNLNAANALLKTLEEPASSTTLILLSHQPSRLLPTIRSRCLQLRFTKPARSQAAAWLREQGVESPDDILTEVQGYPMRALAISETGLVEWRQQRDRELTLFLSEKRSASGLARLWMSFDPADVHAWLYDRLRRINWTVRGQAQDNMQDTALHGLAQMPQMQRLEQLLGQLNQLVLSDLNNINKQLCVESILVSMADDGLTAGY